ncbi:deoxyribonuclease IV [Aquibacillus kalidii]|uniref:deoxyribonuclease IV n=1 Tax=Aquibacillus kalidii TaxID=2762597 RepID=UPI001645340E|nr:deoxyribonuclease IV [Aquibacillus kalidii]
MKFVCHVSIKNGYLGAAKLAKKYNCQAFQYFPKNPRSLTVKDYDKADAALCKKYCKENGMISISHSPYPTNLTPTFDKKQNVVDSLLNDLDISEACGSIGVVVHFGKDKDDDNPLNSYKLMIETLNQTLEAWSGNCKVLIENNVGIPGVMGTTIEEVTQVRKLVDYPDKIGFCFDTCHAFASGIWTGDNWDDFADKANELEYFDHLVAIHFNNSKYEVGSGKDRHANIFYNGKIKEDQWNKLLSSPFIKEIPFILETPDDLGITQQDEIKQLQEKWQ